MKQVVSHWRPRDIVAILGLTIGAILLLQGIDGTVAWSLLVINGVYFGIDLTPFIKIGRNQKTKGGKK